VQCRLNQGLPKREFRAEFDDGAPHTVRSTNRQGAEKMRPHVGTFESFPGPSHPTFGRSLFFRKFRELRGFSVGRIVSRP